LTSSFACAEVLDLSELALTEIRFAYNGNNFGGKIFFQDTKDVSETVSLNGVSKACTKQIR
jgi:hypothetical protein